MKYGAIIFSYLALFSVGFMENSRGAFYSDFIELYNLNSKSGSFLFSISSFSSFLATITSRFWLFRFKSFLVSRFAVIVLGIVSIAFYLITSNNLSYIFFLSINVIYGLAIGLLSISLNNLICEHCEVKTRAKLLSGLHSMYGLASLLAPFIVSFIYKLNFDWRVIFVVGALYSFSIGVYSFFISKKNSVIEEKNQQKTSFPIYFVFGSIAALYVASEIIVSSRLAYYLTSESSFTKVQAGYALSLFFLLLFSGRLVFSLINIKIEKTILLKLSLIFSFIIISLGLYVSPLLLALSALSMSFFFPYFMSYISSEFQRFQKDLIAKSMNFVGAFLFITHWLFGVISDAYSMKVAFMLPLLFLILALYILHFHLTKNTNLSKMRS